ncbi:uncharacterized protein AB675_8447 [Cyphellophora attinorum]|uniref:Uncharacterized protein n=1 Tax=Cyphellophora attinorum TaxID=1664694 RepID=A0A0N0NR60_9EURO|nr:uncharacterized protein AB675_8447 [Phialophora attinorum]KPI44721.1 hypothetical protein AB675_8447 [Phialophora attinorum]
MSHLAPAPAPAPVPQQIFLRDCYMRIQTPDPSLPDGFNAAKMTTLVWNQTPEQVANTINNMHNAHGTNVQLWLKGDLVGMIYAGIYRRGSMPIDVTPQTGLDADNNVISIILPSGVAKLDQVSPDPSKVVGLNKQVQCVYGIHLKDLNRPLVPNDYLYIRMQYLKKFLVDFYKFSGGNTKTAPAPSWTYADGLGRVLVITLEKPPM